MVIDNMSSVASHGLHGLSAQWHSEERARPRVQCAFIAYYFSCEMCCRIFISSATVGTAQNAICKGHKLVPIYAHRSGNNLLVFFFSWCQNGADEIMAWFVEFECVCRTWTTTAKKNGKQTNFVANFLFGVKWRHSSSEYISWYI